MNSIEDILYEVNQELEPSAALKQLLLGCISFSNATRGRIYRINLSDSKYVIENEVNYEIPGQAISFNFLNKTNYQAVTYLEKAIITNDTMLIHHLSPKIVHDINTSQRGSRLIVPIERKGTCLGIIDLESDTEDIFSKEEIYQIEIVSSAIIPLIEKRASLTLYRSLQKPIDFTTSFDDYIDTIMLAVADASEMPSIVIRELVGEKRLKCIAQFGFGNTERSELDFDPYDQYQSFAQAIKEKRTISEPTMDKEYLSNLYNIRKAWNIQSFVVTPILVGKEVFGTLSFGAKCKYYYSNLEQAGFETIANSIGVAISNWRNFHFAQAELIQLTEAQFSTAAVDVAQAARHEARNYLEALRDGITNIRVLSNSPNRENIKKISEKTNELTDIINSISNSLDKIKAATKPLENDLLPISLKRIWQEAFNMVSGRLIKYDIRTHIKGKDCIAQVFPDFLRNAFLQLIINSIDAFSGRKQKGEREISVYLDPQISVNKVKIRYFDNATGIDFSKIKSPGIIDQDLPPQEKIFHIGVSSKEGSGYGLYLVRKIMTDHHGSIDLVDYRNGVVFDLLLPISQ